jgi:hypothetical protein
MNKDLYYKWLFIFSGCWSFIVSAIGLILKQIDPFVAWLVIAFGVGFFFVSQNITKNQGVIVGGIIEKVAAFIISYTTVPIDPKQAIVTAVDLLLAILFIECLIWMRKAKKN